MKAAAPTPEKGDQPATVTSGNKVVEIDPQNPLPEASWFWRRLITIGITIVCLFFIWLILDALHDLSAFDNLLVLAKWIIGLLALVLTYYFIGPSAAELVNMVQTSKIMQRGIEMAEDRFGRGQNRPERHRLARFDDPPAPHSQIPPAAPGGPSTANSEADVAPTARQ